MYIYIYTHIAHTYTQQECNIETEEKIMKRLENYKLKENVLDKSYM